MSEPLVAARLAYLALFAAVFVIDLRTGLIPNRLTYPAIAASILVRPDGVGLLPWSHLVAGLAAAAFIGVLSWRGWMGVGDVKLALLIGLLSGPLLVPIALWVSFVGGGVVGLTLLALRIRGRRDAIPFGPFLAVGGASVMLFGRELAELSGLQRWFAP